MALLEGWGQDGVAVVRLFDTVTNSLKDGLDLGKQLVEEGLARLMVEGEGASRLLPYKPTLVTRQSGGEDRPCRGAQAGGTTSKDDREMNGIDNREMAEAANEENPSADVPNKLPEVQSEQPLVRRLELSSCLLHLVSWKSDTWVTSAEVSLLHGSWKGYDLLERVLEKKAGASFPREQIVEGKQEEVWKGLVEGGVGGLVDRNGQPKEHVSLYRLVDLVDILAILKVELREEDKAAIRSWLSGGGTVLK